MNQKPISEKLFLKYEFIAIASAKKLFHTERLGMSLDDVMQEFRIKLYQVILSYGSSVQRFQESGLKQPIPLQFYIRSSMNNFKKDFIKKIESEKSKKLYIKHTDEHDYATFNDDIINLDFESNKLEINGFSLLGDLSGVEKTVFCLYCKGVSVKKLIKMFSKIVDVKTIIQKQVEYLKENKDDYYPENKTELFVTKYVD